MKDGILVFSLFSPWRFGEFPVGRKAASLRIPRLVRATVKGREFLKRYKGQSLGAR
jgi:hypothetical protein